MYIRSLVLKNVLPLYTHSEAVQLGPNNDLQKPGRIGVARFFFVECTKTGNNVYQHLPLQDPPKLGFLLWIYATCQPAHNIFLVMTKIWGKNPPKMLTFIDIHFWGEGSFQFFWQVSLCLDQCLTWQSRPQYLWVWHREHLQKLNDWKCFSCSANECVDDKWSVLISEKVTQCHWAQSMCICSVKLSTYVNVCSAGGHKYKRVYSFKWYIF
jgi:hypothetical protein